MVNFAHIINDENQKEIVKGRELTDRDRNSKDYFCPNENCETKLALNIKSNGENYFSASYDGFDHIKNCWAESKYANQVILPPKDKNINDFLNSLSKSEPRKSEESKSEKYDMEDNVTHRRMSTLKDIFYYCKSHNKENNFGDTKIKYMFLDSRTKNIYTKFIHEGTKVVIGDSILPFNPKDEMFKIKYNNKFYFKINFINSSVFNKCYKKLNLKGRNLKDVNVMVLGDWKRSGNNTLVTCIKNSKQFLDISSFISD
ncbi:hypothetical protein QI181_01605 [Staphylococcus saprophyticus]|nr:hypothetical protein [Staphylococcus saprophyticus]MDW4242054.1 hypothetical protein [Staphylococcus saprophyticus]MDW4480375.1 hypothetical protein [Staphylococcus saprophyticus]